MESYDAFALRVLSEDERIRMFHTHVVIRGKTRAPDRARLTWCRVRVIDAAPS